jgi:lysophospholipase L1-like esterase
MPEQPIDKAITAAEEMRKHLAGNGKNLTERLREAGAKPVMAMEAPPEARDMPIAAIIRDWLEGANEHYRRAGLELTASYARKLLELEDQRHAYMRRMLEALTK